MRYGPEMIEKVLAELEKVPNIRYVCNKVGIDHSTFYRWMGAHAKFHKLVELSLYIGREKMNDAAESVIINGIQNNDYRSATYYLSHNHERYIGAERVKYFQYLEKYKLQFMRHREEGDALTESLFEHFLMLETTLDPGIARQEMSYIASAMYLNDAGEMKNFRDKYLIWKETKKRKKPGKEGPEEEDSYQQA